MHTRILAPLRSPTFWVLVVLFGLEFFLFDQFGARRHTPVYPRWHDQVQYLSESYTGYEFARSRGVVAGLLNALTTPSAQGTLHDFLAIVVFLFAGPSRSAALSVNLFAVIGWQAALFVEQSESSPVDRQSAPASRLKSSSQVLSTASSAVLTPHAEGLFVRRSNEMRSR